MGGTRKVGRTVTTVSGISMIVLSKLNVNHRIRYCAKSVLLLVYWMVFAAFD